MTSDTDSMADQFLSRQNIWGRIWNAIIYVMLSVSVCVCLFSSNIHLYIRLVAVALSAVWGVWYWLFIAGARSWNNRLITVALSVLVSIAIATVLTWLHPIFVIILFAYFGITFRALPAKPSIPFVILASVMIAVRYMDFSGGFSVANNALFLSGFLVMSFLASVFGLFISSISRQSKERKRMLEELESTQSELKKAEREAGIVAERQRLAGEIHDTLAQGFTSIILQLQNAELALEADPVQSRLFIERALQAARDGLSEARRVLWALRPEILEREPFRVALEQVAEKWRESIGISVSVESSGEQVTLSPAAAITLLRAVQEALANVYKHANASYVDLKLSYLQKSVSIDVTDNGEGFAANALENAGRVTSKGYGLKAMRERVEGIGGTVRWESARGKGSSLFVEVPVDDASQEVGR